MQSFTFRSVQRLTQHRCQRVTEKRFTSTLSTMTNYPILITSDVVCPWCYIGHTRLQKAIAAHKTTYPDDSFNLKYVPFYLNPPPQLESNDIPAFPVKSVNKRDYYASKFGPERGKAIEQRMIETAAGEGLNFSFDGNTGISRNGHRLVYYGQTHGGEEAQNAVMLGLWKRYYEQAVDITTLETLVDVGVEAGLGSAEGIKEFLVSGRDGVEVDKLAESSRMNGISGVPNYVICDTWEVSGAQDPKVFTQLFQRWKSMEEKKQSSQDSDTGADKANACL